MGLITSLPKLTKFTAFNATLFEHFASHGETDFTIRLLFSMQKSSFAGLTRRK
jgi:hypothetical protein